MTLLEGVKRTQAHLPFRLSHDPCSSGRLQTKEL
jgi:hypothetical protein